MSNQRRPGASLVERLAAASAVAGYLNQDLSNEKGLSTTIQALVDQGRLGMKTKGGLFDYTDEEIGQLRAARGAALVKVRKALS